MTNHLRFIAMTHVYHRAVLVLTACWCVQVQALEKSGPYISSLSYYSFPPLPQLMDSSLIGALRNTMVKASVNTRHCFQHYRVQKYTPCGRTFYNSNKVKERKITAIEVPDVFTVNVTFERFRLEQSVEHCAFEDLLILCSRNYKPISKRVLCGSRYPWDEICIGNQVFLMYNRTSPVRKSREPLGYALKFSVMETIGTSEKTVIYHYRPEMERSSYWRINHFEQGPPATKFPYPFKTAASFWIEYIWTIISDLHLVLNTHVFMMDTSRRRIVYMDTTPCLSYSIHDGPNKHFSKLAALRPVNGIRPHQTSSGFTATVVFFKPISCVDTDAMGFYLAFTAKRSDIRVDDVNITSDQPKVRWSGKVPATDKPMFYIHAVNITNLRSRFINTIVWKYARSSPAEGDCRYSGLAVFDSDRLEMLQHGHRGHPHHVHLQALAVIRPLFVLCKLVWITKVSGYTFPIPHTFHSSTFAITVIAYSYRVIASFSTDYGVTAKSNDCRGWFALCEPLPKFTFAGTAFLPREPPTYVARSYTAKSTKMPAIYNNFCPHGEEKDPRSMYIEGKTGALCSTHADDRRRNYLLVYDEGCVVFQHWPNSFVRVKDRYRERCEMAVIPTTNPDAMVTTTYLIPSYIREDSVNCQRRSRVSIPKRLYDQKTRPHHFSYAFDQNCTTVLLLMHPEKIYEYKRTEIKTQPAVPWGLGEYFFNYSYIYNMIPVHYTEKITVMMTDVSTSLRMARSMRGIKQYQIPEWDFSYGISPAEQRRIQQYSHFRTYPFMLNELGFMHIRLNRTYPAGCVPGVCGLVYLYHVVPTSSNYSHPTEMVYHRVLDVCSLYLDPGTFVIVDFAVFTERAVFAVQDDTQWERRDVCEAVVEVTTEDALPSYMKSTHAVTSCCGGVISQIYFVIWKQDYLSWVEASDRCEAAGGRLPNVHSWEQLSTLEHMILGTQFDMERPSFVSPIKMFTFAAVYLGLNITKVTQVHYTYS